jgi:hypothetical protein
MASSSTVSNSFLTQIPCLLLTGVGAAFGGVDELFSQALSDGLDVTESGFTGTNRQESDGLVDTSQWGHIDGLTTDSSGGTDSGGIFARTAVENGINGDLDGVLVGDEVDDLERVLNNSHGLQLLSVVASVHHKGVGESLDDWALGLAEALDGISSGGMWEVDWLELDVVAGVLSEFRFSISISRLFLHEPQRHIPGGIDTFVGPLVEQFDGSSLRDNISWEHRGVNLGNFNFSAIRHRFRSCFGSLGSKIRDLAVCIGEL